MSEVPVELAADAADAPSMTGMPTRAIATTDAAILDFDIWCPPNGIRILKF
jgi:hypothetical protein